MTETEAKWSERVGRWRESGQSAGAFSAGQEFEPSTLRYWASRLKRRPTGPGKVEAAAQSKARPVPSRVRMVRVERSATRPGFEPVLVVVVGGVRVEVRAGFDVALLRAVVDALAGRTS